VLFSRREGGSALLVGLDNGVPFAEISNASGKQRTPAGEALTAGAWRHLGVVASGAQLTLFLDGKSAGTLAAGLPALKSAAHLGGDVAEGATEVTAGFAGEVDELQISKIARPPGALLFSATGQGTTDAAGKLVAVGNDEESGHGGHDVLAEHVNLIKDISKDLTIDGWVVIVLCALLALVGGVVTVLKFAYLNKISTATKAFQKQWENLSADLSVLDHGDEESVKSMGGKASTKVQKAMRQSPLYHLYQLGYAEIQHRVVNAREDFRGLSGRSMEAIKATLDGGLVREVQRLNSQLVFLTIGIAGGPYLGLLGTVIGVMITFAVIAKSGEVEVNSIAPGIAGALLATVAGLAVAIPALFAYSYISSRIKDSVSDMQVFIDEFVAKIAEAYPETD
jgi:biopolymer transport protein ExbB